MDTAPSKTFAALDGNEAAARVAYALSEVAAIYPITPASPMGEWADLWAAEGRPNLWGNVPRVIEMQSEAGAAGALHGALSAGALATTFTASQGLLLMIPTLYKIAGELTPFVVHVAARAVATHALSIFGDHSDVMAARATGTAMLCSASVQEAMDLALVAHAATLESRVPFLHFFDGFRTSHEMQKIRLLDDGDMRALIAEARIQEHRRRALSPDHPTLRGTSQDPDVFFQGREAANPYYRDCPGLVQAAMDALALRTGRAYKLFDYFGDPQGERVIVMMGSGSSAAEEAVEALRLRGEAVGLVKVRLYRPFSVEAFLKALPPSVRAVAVLDRTKEPGSAGEPLYLDAAASLQEGGRREVRLIGGRYGLASKEFTPAMAAAVFAELSKPGPKNHFTVGIRDDVTRTSLAWDPGFATESRDTSRAVFHGLGSDGTVGASKSAVKLIAEHTDLHVQGYFVFDSKKSGSRTVSHLRFGPRPILSTYLISSAQFVACNQESLLERVDVLACAAPGATFLLNSPDPGKAWERLPRRAQEALIAKGLRFFAIDTHAMARAAGLRGRINTVMETCFFSLTGVLPNFQERLKEDARRAYAAKGAALVEANLKAIDGALSGLKEVPVPARPTAPRSGDSSVASDAPAFVRGVTEFLLAGRGNELPVSAIPPDGTWPTGTSRFEKRGLASELPVWREELCLQCNKCALVCPHAAIRVKAYPGSALSSAPRGFKRMDWKGRDFAPGTRYTVQTAPEDCTGCTLCVEICPAMSKAGPEEKALKMAPAAPLMEIEKRRWNFFESLPQAVAVQEQTLNVKYSQLRRPLFEFSGACSGCGQTPYLKLLTQLYGEELAVANATGCSSIYGGNLPTTPWTAGPEGRGPAWSNSLFENNAEFGLGFRLAFDKRCDYARELLKDHALSVGEALAAALLGPGEDPRERRARIAALRRALEPISEGWARDLSAAAESLGRRSVWIVGGDGWAYDIGAGGLDHVLRSGADVNLLVLDTEVYSNTGGQASKATPRGAVAKFASSGKSAPRKDLVLEAIVAGGAFVAQVALGADDTQALAALKEADAYPGPSLVVAYAPCIAHGYDLSQGIAQQRLAVQSGYWPLLRFDPRKASLRLDSPGPKIPFQEYAVRENRYRMLMRSHPEDAAKLLALAQEDVERRWDILRRLASPKSPSA